MLCKAKRQCPLTSEVSRYCLLALHGSILHNRIKLASFREGGWYIFTDSFAGRVSSPYHTAVVASSAVLSAKYLHQARRTLAQRLLNAGPTSVTLAERWTSAGSHFQTGLGAGLFPREITKRRFYYGSRRWVFVGGLSSCFCHVCSLERGTSGLHIKSTFYSARLHSDFLVTNVIFIISHYIGQLQKMDDRRGSRGLTTVHVNWSAIHTFTFDFKILTSKSRF